MLPGVGHSSQGWGGHPAPLWALLWAGLQRLQSTPSKNHLKSSVFPGAAAGRRGASVPLLLPAGAASGRPDPDLQGFFISSLPAHPSGPFTSLVGVSQSLPQWWEHEVASPSLCSCLGTGPAPPAAASALREAPSPVHASSTRFGYELNPSIACSPPPLWQQ